MYLRFTPKSYKPYQSPYGCCQAATKSSPSKQRSLIEPVSYDFFCYVTTENYTPWQTHKTYGKRATSETGIEEAKSQRGLAHLKTDSFLANAALFQCAILAYNTLRWMALSSGNT